MLHKTHYEDFIALAKQSSRIVVSQEIYADMLTPIRVFQVLSEGLPQAVLLDSSDHATSQDACIYLGFDPIASCVVQNHHTTIKTPNGESADSLPPFDALRQFYHTYRAVAAPGLAKFAGGMIGYMGYDATRYIEVIPDRHSSDATPEMHFTFYGTNIVFDKRTGKALITRVVTVDAGQSLVDIYQQAMDEIAILIQKMHQTHYPAQQPATVECQDPFAKVSIESSDAEFQEIVKKAKAHIHAGDAFQIVLSRRFNRPYTGNDFDIYRALRVLNPSPYQFYIRDEAQTIVGASPEKLVSLQGGIVEVNPIAGTRSRGQTREEDIALEQDLLSDEKEIAEHMMLVDLGRNDVGRVADIGSVCVAELKKINRFSRVMHICSRITGCIKVGCDAFDVLQAAFPAGTLSGAPKVRAMEIIDNLEASRRGLYGGAIVSIDNIGQMDSCIAIRMAVVRDGIASVRAGAGVVLDSDPEAEAYETRHKVSGVMDALALAEGGLV